SWAKASSRRSRPLRVLDVGLHRLETEFAVDGDSGRVVALDVEDHLLEPTLPQVAQSGQGQRLAESPALRVGVDTDDVDLPDGTPTETVRVGRVHFRPVEAHDPALGVLGEEEPVGVEPALPLRFPQRLHVELALFGVPVEGTRVDGYHRLLVLAGDECA